MDDRLIFSSMLEMINNAMPSSFIVLDTGGRIERVWISRRKTHQLRLVGKHFVKVIPIIFSAENSQTLKQAYFECLKFRRPVTIHRMIHMVANGLNEYYKWQFSPVSGCEYITIFIQNITEDVMIEEEFNSICEQHNAVNRELYAAMSNLDLQYMDLEQAHKKLAALYRITSVVQRTVSLPEIFEEIINGLVQELGYLNAAIFTLNEEKTKFVIQSHRGYMDNITVPISQGIIGYAATIRDLVYVPDVKADPRYIPGTKHGISEVAIPLIVNDMVIGILDVETPEGKKVKKYDLDLLRSLASQIALTIAHATYVTKVQMQAVTDSLTDLSNYRYFRSVLDQELKRALRYDRPVSMLMIDIDNYKHYNDTHGHRMGDEVLKRVAKVIKEAVRDVDLVARYGGEEFAVLCPETPLTEAQIIAERIRYNIEEYPFLYKTTQPGGALTVSIGVACYPDHALSAEELIDRADNALYLAKRMTKNCVCLFGMSG